MFFRTIFVYLVGFLLVKLVEMDPVKITFEVHTEQKNTLTCDHSDNKQLNKYTILEGEQFTIVTKYKQIINHLICHAYNNENDGFHYKNTFMKNKTTFVGEKRMGTLWKCTILAHRDNRIMKPVVPYKGVNYSAAYCFMKIHVRQKVPPQTILVNNMNVSAVREDQVEKDVDFTAEYQYADGDIVNVACANFLKEPTSSLTMEYEMAGTKSNDSTVKDITSNKMIGFVTKLHSGHNNSYMICTNTETDYTEVKLIFVMKTKLNIVSIAINGMIQRPVLTNAPNYHYEINYKFAVNQSINVMCEVEQTDVKLVVSGDDVAKSKDYKKTDLIPNKKTEIRFHLNAGDVDMGHKTLPCSADYVPERVAESVYIKFTKANFPFDLYPSFHMELSSNGSVMELYSYKEHKLTVISYEFEHDETLNLTCGSHVFKQPGPLVYLQFNNTVDCGNDGCYDSKPLNVTRGHVYPPIVCYLKEKNNDQGPLFETDKVFNEIRVIVRERPVTITTTSSTTTTTTTTTALVETRKASSTTAADYYITEPPQKADYPEKKHRNKLREGSDDRSNILSNLPVIAGVAACIIIICVSIAIIIIIRFRKRNHSQGGPSNRNYENLAEPSEESIPAYPPQWENNYAVPVDSRTDDTTYSVPCLPGDLYATPTPKNLRNKKQKPLEPTYAVLAVQKGQAKKNVFKESDDPNYSEVYANSQEQCYAKVLPKNMRNQIEQDDPYSYVTNEPPYVNTDDPEPMYCEPGKAQGAEYANLNNSHYANSNAQEYVEPTYCEPQKRMK